MTAETVLLETCASAIRVLARWQHAFNNPLAVLDLPTFNKKLDPKIYEVFSNNKHHHQETTRLIPSRNRKTFNRRIQRSEAIDGAIKILGRESNELNEFKSFLNRITPYLILNKQKLTRIVPDFNFDHFQNFANIASNLKIYGEMLQRHSKLNKTQYSYIAEQFNAVKLSAGKLASLMDNPLVLQLTNFCGKDKKNIAVRLKKISEQGSLGKESKLRDFIQELQEVHSLLGNVFAPELLKPLGIAFIPPRRRAFSMRAPATCPTSRGRIAPRRETVASKRRQAREAAGQAGFSFAQ